ncbi:hypothetical protein [Paracoccus sp. S1E-3]|uniref:hypothetical protein n=1 Tax=Paracoccus sp. S1E-3 TaxID=2756130 RepID=UPI0015EE9E6D|nr:hypothetical protein [Paracoccus sp. S1E-3]MBA4492422.1 hypothetical protein [Paracoccus sp. S1E-3]
MIPDYLSQFPIPANLLPLKLLQLLQPVDSDPSRKVEVTSHYDFDQFGPRREYCHMLMALSPQPTIHLQDISSEAGEGVVEYSTPDVRAMGGLSDFVPSVSGLDYVVASWGDGSFYTYNLAEKVWMALGLSPRCIGGDPADGGRQKIIFDDLSLPEFGVVEGEISTQHYFSVSRNVSWQMSNEHLRRYLWMRGCHGVRVFYYEAAVADCEALRALMNGETSVEFKPDPGWFELCIREYEGQLLLQLWATVTAVTPELCRDKSADGLLWPGDAEPMTRNRARQIRYPGESVFLDDRFLKRYEQNHFFNSTPFRSGSVWRCSPSYQGQWAFRDCIRVGRNLIRVPMRELYKGLPDREIIHAHSHALAQAKVAEFDLGEEHIVEKTQRYLDVLLELGDMLEELGRAVGRDESAPDIVKFDRQELKNEGWTGYPELCRLAQVAPLDMSEQEFLSRCKNIHEIAQRVPNGFLRSLIKSAGHDGKDIKEFAGLRLLQAMTNILERLNADGEQIDAFGAGTIPEDLTVRNCAMAALFLNNDLRIADAHDAGGVLVALERLDFDVAALNEGYGRALDHVLDAVVASFAHLNSQLRQFLER